MEGGDEVGHVEVRCGGVAGTSSDGIVQWREVMRWAMRKSGVVEWLVQAVMALYSGGR